MLSVKRAPLSWPPSRSVADLEEGKGLIDGVRAVIVPRLRNHRPRTVRGRQVRAVFEIAIHDFRHVRLQMGRWHFRTSRTRQLGAFFREKTAETCVAQLEGWAGLAINMIPAYTRLEDWRFDR